jgi:DNA-binding transcriptional MerR regulator
MAPKARVQKRLYYKIGEACKALDIQPYVLRYWETEFPPLSPNKSRSGQRVYSEKELGIIRRIKELLYDEGYTIAGAKKKLEAELASGSLGGADEADDDESPVVHPRAKASMGGRGDIANLPEAIEAAATADPADLADAADVANAANIADVANAASVADIADAAGLGASPIRTAPRPRSARPSALPTVAAGETGVPPGGESEQQSLLLDTHAAERIESMRKGIQQAVAEARELLALLAAKIPPRSSV